MYALWLFTDILKDGLDKQFFAIIILISPIIGIKLIRKRRNHEKYKH